MTATLPVLVFVSFNADEDSPIFTVHADIALTAYKKKLELLFIRICKFFDRPNSLQATEASCTRLMQVNEVNHVYFMAMVIGGVQDLFTWQFSSHLGSCRTAERS